MNIARGLAALFLTTFFTSTLFAEYLYKDELLFNENLTVMVEDMGAELREKTGVGLYIVAVREIDNNRTIVELERDVMEQLEKPAVIIAFSEFDKKIDIYARPISLYKDFDKDGTLSPFPAFGGTILPILTAKSKDTPVAEKYAAALGNGYADVAEQIAASRDVKLDTAIGSTNRNIVNLLRIAFYGTILFAVGMYIRQKFFKKKKQDEETA